MRLAARRLTRLDLLLFVLLTLTSLRGYHMRDEALTSVRGEQAVDRDVLYHTDTHSPCSTYTNNRGTRRGCNGHKPVTGYTSHVGVIISPSICAPDSFRVDCSRTCQAEASIARCQRVPVTCAQPSGRVHLLEGHPGYANEWLASTFTSQRAEHAERARIPVAPIRALAPARSGTWKVGAKVVLPRLAHLMGACSRA